ncbi:acylphosphatase [Hymenobacter sp. DG25A]|uniref:acylphosphatase n=1 Tax=Hymenobacter sp. DG25A TaxID=1385663 RepID=UPI0006BE0823|nr:acylphosphatase [Hymenobacter sp. DG25A]ALD21610.1 acylphosphatase [Hymenobacter sp. DG25A]
MSIEHRTFQIYGRVQGVFYRQSSQQEARRLGLTGFARNNPDGTVTIEAEGPPDALDALLAWCQKGPAAAQVERVEVTPGQLHHYKEFSVRRA